MFAHPLSMPGRHNNKSITDVMALRATLASAERGQALARSLAK
ncbi:uncharacterized protein METZ01_LOCUS253488, partial [marine metagenome]